MKIHYWGHVDDLTNSMKFINTTNGRILIDCGSSLDPNEIRKVSELILANPLEDIVAIIVTNAQVDHTEYLLEIINDGFSKPIYCTPIVYEKIRHVLSSLSVGRENSLDDEKADSVLKLIKTFEFGEKFEIDDTKNSFIYNGNSPTVPSVLIHTKKSKLVFSNDFEKIGNQNLLSPTGTINPNNFYTLDCDDNLPSIWQARNL